MRRQLVKAAAAALMLLGAALAGVPETDVVERGSARTAMPDGSDILRRITRYQRATWRWQRLMGVPRTRSLRRVARVRDLEYRVFVMHQWRRRAIRARRRALNPPHESAWRCIQRYEAAWNDAWDPYWGGLQMDTTFMRHHAPRHLLRRGWANTWTPIEQMWVGERALRAGRGFYPWPNAARICGLL